MKKSKNLFVLCALSILFCLPYISALEMTEIMYNPIGTDTEREWVEFLVEEEILISQLRFFTPRGNHLIHAVNGQDTLYPGDIVIMSNGPDLFLAEYPLFSGILVRSSFYLSNSGEEIGFRLTGQEPLDAYHYTTEYGNGNGMTLEKRGGIWLESEVLGGTPGYLPDYEVPEFGTIAIGLALAGALFAIFSMRKR